jgi:NAD(P)-dependent dehydrogenase (short-subunit alcohol dehydrogenase family)
MVEDQGVADVISFLAGPQASFVTGSDWIVDGRYECWSWK